MKFGIQSFEKHRRLETFPRKCRPLLHLRPLRAARRVGEERRGETRFDRDEFVSFHATNLPASPSTPAYPPCEHDLPGCAVVSHDLLSEEGVKLHRGVGLHVGEGNELDRRAVGAEHVTFTSHLPISLRKGCFETWQSERCLKAAWLFIYSEQQVSIQISPPAPYLPV